MHRRIYECLLVRNVSRSRSWKETPGVSVAPSGMCPRRSGKHLHLGTLTALGNNSAFAWFFFFFFVFNCLPCTHAQTQALTLIPADSANKDSEMPLLQHQWTQIWWGKVRHKHSSIKKKIGHCLCFPLYLLHSLNYGMLKCRKIFTCRLEGKMGFNTEVR